MSIASQQKRPSPHGTVAPKEASVSRASAASLCHPAQRGGDRIIIVLLMALAAFIRLDFMGASQWSIDSDEAIVGLMGKHILEGRGIPTFYYGQHYMGSLEAILASGSFALFGVSPFALSLVPLACAVLLVPLMYALGKAISGRTAGLVAALLIAFPPAGLIIWSTKARGGFIEILFLGAAALLITTKWFQDDLKKLRYPTMLGAVLGLGWWVNNQIIYFIFPIAAFSLAALLEGVARGSLRPSRLTAIVLIGSAAFFAAGAPYWTYNIRLGFPSFGMFGIADGEAIAAQRRGLFAVALPILLGATRFWSSREIFPHAAALVYAAYGAMLGGLLWFRRRQLAALVRGQVDRSAPIELVLLVIPFSCLIFTVSTYGRLYEAPRYLLPLYVSLFVAVGAFVAALARFSRAAAALLVAVVLGINAASAYLGGRAIAGEPIVFDGERVARDHTELIAALDELGLTYVRTNYWIGYRLAFETGERITFSLFQEPHHLRIPEYERGLTPKERERIPLVLVPSEAKLVRQALTAARVPFSERKAGSYVIIHTIQSPSRPVQVLPSAEIAGARGSSNQPALLALDGDRSTRWGTGRPQEPGMSFEVDFRRPVVVSGLEYDIGLWPHDSPRRLRVELILPTGERKTVLKPEDWPALNYLFRMNGGFQFEFEPTEANGVVLTQTGMDRRMDWSIGELVFLSPAVPKQ